MNRRLQGAAWPALLCASAACASDFATTRPGPPRGTLGHELFIVLCDRVAAQALPEDVTGDSWHAVCHPDADGAFATTVDQSWLPPLDPNAVDVDGNPVPLPRQQAERAYRVARIEALARDRQTLAAAVDAAVPAQAIALKDLGNPDPAQSCNPGGGGPLPAEVAATVGRMVSLEDDGTIPLFTEALGRVMNDVKAMPDAQDALARFDARQGYRPLEVAMGIGQPVLTYPQLVPLVQSLLTVVATDSDPYNPAGAIDPSKPLGVGNRRPIPGPAAAQMQQLLAVGREELRTATPPAALPPIAASADPQIPSRQLLSRPWTTLELTRQIALRNDAAFDVGLASTSYVVQRDGRAFAAVSLVDGAVPPPFVDTDGDGLPDVDGLGRFITSDGKPAVSPFFSPDGVDGARDSAGRAMGQSTPTLYGYVNVGQTFMANLEQNIRPLADPDPANGHESLMNLVGGAYLLFGNRDGGPKSTRTYAPDPTSAKPNAPVTIAYDAFHPETSPLQDLVYALGVLMADPEMDDLLQLGSKLMAQQPAATARLVGLALQIKAIADAHPEAHIPAGSTLWDELLDVIAQIAHVRDGVGGGGLLEDLLTAFAQEPSVQLQKAFADYARYKDAFTYDHGSKSGGLSNAFNGAAWNLSSSDTAPLHVPVDRSQPDVGSNQSGLQRVIQLLHDVKDLDFCTKAGAVAHVTLDLSLLGLNLGTIPFDYPTNALTPLACGFVGAPTPPNPLPRCGILRIQNVGALLLDVVLGSADLALRDPCLVALMNSPLASGTGGPDAFLQAQSGIAGFDSHPTFPGLGRLVYFEAPSALPGNPAPLGDTNPSTLTTSTFLSGLIDPIPATVCPLTPFKDADGTVLQLRTCTTFADTLRGRDPGFIFPLEQDDFVKDLRPLAAAFKSHGQAELFVDLLDSLHLHWADAQVPASECDPTLPRTDARWCSQDGAVSYEPLLADVLTQTDLFQALHDSIPIVQGITIQHCDATDPTTGACTASSTRNGMQVLAQAIRVTVDPAMNQGLVDGHGVQTAPRNDGTTNPQVTPIYLFVDALKGIDAAFAAWAQAHPSDDRHPAWLAARSRMVDQFLTVNGSGTSASWANPAVPAIVPPLLDTLSSQILAQCPDRSSRAACTWWTKSMPQNVAGVLGGPTFAAVMDLLDAVRANADARARLEQLLQYLLDPAPGSPRGTVMTSSVDLLQILSDDTDITPFYGAAHDVLGAQTVDASGTVVSRGLAGAGIEVLARTFAAARDAQGHETCSAEVDPNGAVAQMLVHLVTPPVANQNPPLETLLDVIADVNRAHPDQTTKLDGADYGNIANEVSELCLDPSSGLEQMYGVIRAATMTDPGN